MAIGIFDSGLGGLTVVRQVRKYYPNEKIIYYGDSLRVPYGGRKPEELIMLADKITGFLVDEGAKVIIDACNTTSALAIDYLRDKYPVPIYGVLTPGARGAVSATKGKVGLIATEATVNSGVYQKHIMSAAKDIQMVSKACPKLVPHVEMGDLSSELLNAALKEYIKEITSENCDTLILGCTHYPFLREKIEKMVGEVSIVDPAEELLKELPSDLLGNEGESHCFVSSRPEEFKNVCQKLLPNHGFSKFTLLDVLAEEILGEKNA